MRDRIAALRARGERIVIGLDNYGYYDLGTIEDPGLRTAIVKHHRMRSRDFLIAHAVLMRQISGMTAEAVAGQMLFDALIPADDQPAEPYGVDDLVRVPPDHRMAIVRLAARLIRSLNADPVALAAERAYVAETTGFVPLSRAEYQRLQQAKELLAGVGQ